MKTDTETKELAIFCVKKILPCETGRDNDELFQLTLGKFGRTEAFILFYFWPGEIDSFL